MNSRLIAALATATFAALAIGGCASEPADPNAKPAAPREVVYRTGSNIPVRDARPLTKEEQDAQTEAAQRYLSRPTGAGIRPQ
jgi:hypothetical protein